MHLFRQAGRLLIVVALAAGGIALFGLAGVSALNSELYGRLTETQTVEFAVASVETDPLIRLVIHKILPDENAVEASLTLVIEEETELGQEIKNQGVVARAIVEDGSSQHVLPQQPGPH